MLVVIVMLILRLTLVSISIWIFVLVFIPVPTPPLFSVRGSFSSPFCTRIRGTFEHLGVPCTYVEFDAMSDGRACRDAFNRAYGCRTVPQVFINGQKVGGCDETMAALADGRLKQMLAEVNISIQ